MAEKVLCLFGDSNTWGSRPGNWADLLKYDVEEKDIFVYNLGILGDTTTGVLKRLKAEAAARAPTHILFAIGGNDAGVIIKKRRFITPLPLFKRNLKKLLAAARRFTRRVAFLGIIDMDDSRTRPIPWMPSLEYTHESRIVFDNALEKFCRANKVLYIPRRGILLKKDLYDGLHPTSAGHAKIFARTRAALMKFLG